MLQIPKQIIQKIVLALGYKMTRISQIDPVIDRDETFQKIYAVCRPFTMTSKERMYALYKSVEYIVRAHIPGDFVECGVWKGGSAMLMALTLIELGITNKKIYLYDTYEGMPQPTEFDGKATDNNSNVIDKWTKKQNVNYNEWCYASLREVKENMALTKYPAHNLVYVKGKVEKTIPKTKPSKIALLRLDTDWYESTKHELIHLYPGVVKRGVLIIDDYGYWTGAKKAVDEYFSRKPILLTRIDDTGRIGVKP